MLRPSPTKEFTHLRDYVTCDTAVFLSFSLPVVSNMTMKDNLDTGLSYCLYSKVDIDSCAVKNLFLPKWAHAILATYNVVGSSECQGF